MTDQENSFWDRIFEHRVLLHIAFWLCILMLAPLTSYGNIQFSWQAILFRGVLMPMKIIPTYFLVYFLFPRFWQRKKYVEFVLYFVISTFVFTVLYRLINIHVAETIIGSKDPKESLWQIIQEWKFTVPAYLFRVYYSSFSFVLFRIYRRNELRKRAMLTLEREKSQAELNFLRAQIHPHFLFNTLNNLYALTLDKSDDAPEVVAKLADMLDYMLYQCSEPRVLISKEIELLNNYIDLEKLRYGHRLQLTFEHSIDNPSARIAPLILISVVENAFKHGASSAMHDIIIQISLSVSSQQLHFRVFNTKGTQHNPQADYKKGIGAKNIQRQLELVYPGQYEWTVNEEADTYEVNFTLNTP